MTSGYQSFATAVLMTLAGPMAGQYERTVVQTIDSTRTPAELFGTAKRWIVEAFPDSRNAIVLEDAAAFLVVGQGTFRYEPTIQVGGESRRGVVTFKVEIECRAGRYRFRFFQFDHGAKVSLGTIKADSLSCTDELWPNYRRRVCTEEVWPQIHKVEERLLASLRAAMTATKTSGDW